MIIYCRGVPLFFQQQWYGEKRSVYQLCLLGALLSESAPSIEWIFYFYTFNISWLIFLTLPIKIALGEVGLQLGPPLLFFLSLARFLMPSSPMAQCQLKWHLVSLSLSMKWQVSPESVNRIAPPPLNPNLCSNCFTFSHQPMFGTLPIYFFSTTLCRLDFFYSEAHVPPLSLNPCFLCPKIL